MKKNSLLFGIFLSVFFTACDPASTTKDSSNNKDTTEKADNKETPKSEAIPLIPESDESKNESGSFVINVIKSDIASPRKEMKTQLAGSPITINYGSPSVKGRNIWGDLVPFGKVWRMGANEATTIEISKDINIEGQKLAAGKYGLFTIPNTEEWTIIFNETFDQWGAFEYDETKDILRVNVAPKAVTQNSETMDFSVEGNALILNWEKLSIPIKVKS